MIFIPVGSLEVHGNLPYGTDALISRACAQRMAQNTDSFIFPAIYTGVCPNTQNFTATIGIDPVSFISYLEKVTLSVLNTFRKAVFINIHNGNDAAIRTVVEQLYLSHSKTVLYVNPYTCLKERDPFLGEDNNIKEASLLFASLEILGLDPTPYRVEKDAIEEKDRDIAALKEYGYFGYSYFLEGQHISPVAGIDLIKGRHYLDLIGESAKEMIRCFEIVLEKQEQEKEYQR